MGKQAFWRGVGMCGGLVLALGALVMILLSAWPLFSHHRAVTLISPPATITATPRPPRLVNPLRPARVPPAPSVKRAADAIMPARITETLLAQKAPARTRAAAPSRQNSAGKPLAPLSTIASRVSLASVPGALSKERAARRIAPAQVDAPVAAKPPPAVSPVGMVAVHLQPSTILSPPPLKRAAGSIRLATVDDPADQPSPTPQLPAAPPSPDKAAARVQLASVSPPPVLRARPVLADLSSLETERRFVMAMCRDPSGNLWLGCEDEGVWRLDARGHWTQFTTKDGLGDDNAYALAVDQQGRIWAGHLNHGVSVYNGQKWQCYEVVGGLSRPDTLSGPLGERVFDIAVCPTDGDVWIATNAGLSRYSPKSDDWSYYTRGMSLVHGKVAVASGQLPVASEEQSQSTGNRPLATGNLFPPSDQVQAMAFDAEGNIYCATQCDGMAMADARDGYSHWRTVRGPERMPTEPAGKGLPTSLMNDVLVARDGTVYAATTTGLAWSKDKGRTWYYVRGKDYADKVRGLYGGPPKGWTQTQPSAALLATGNRPLATSLLPEDYVTCLAEGPDGLLWIGYRQKGYESLDPKTGEQSPAAGSAGKFVTALVPDVSGRPMAVGTYGDGQEVAAGAALAIGDGVKLPAGATPPTEAMLGEIAEQTKASSLGSIGGDVAYFGEDWITQGDWIGRYGRQAAVLCATGGSTDHLFHWGNAYTIRRGIGLNHRSGDSLRSWIHWLSTDNSKSLWDPAVGTRRQSEWDDHGEGYPMTVDGPDISVGLKVPEGVHRISLYFFNKDGHRGANRYRDFLVTLSQSDSKRSSGGEGRSFTSQSRVRDFSGPVYKSFLINQSGSYTLLIKRNGSLNTIVSGIFFERISGPSLPTDRLSMPFTGGTGRFTAPPIPDFVLDRSNHLTALASLWTQMTRDNLQASIVGKRLVFRAAVEQKAGEAVLANWRWEANLWTLSDRKAFSDYVAGAWAARQYQQLHPPTRSLGVRRKPAITPNP